MNTRRAVADLGDHLEAERLPVERGRSAGVAHVEDCVVETANVQSCAFATP